MGVGRDKWEGRQSGWPGGMRQLSWTLCCSPRLRRGVSHSDTQYVIVQLGRCDNEHGKAKPVTMQLHQLVAYARYGPPPEGHEGPTPATSGCAAVRTTWPTCSTS